MLLEGVMALEQGAVMMEGELPGDAIPIPSVKVWPGNLNRSYHWVVQVDHNWDNADRIWGAGPEFLDYLLQVPLVVAVLALVALAGALPSPAQQYVPHP